MTKALLSFSLKESVKIPHTYSLFIVRFSHVQCPTDLVHGRLVSLTYKRCAQVRA